jgi:hypothetical protein
MEGHAMSVDVRNLPPVGYDSQTNRPIFTRIPIEQRAKFFKRWAQMDAEGKEQKHYSRYEWQLRKSLEELEVREEQLDACIRKGPQ